MAIWVNLAALLAAYLLGAIPVGLLVVKILTGKDLRRIQSGRTGGTNAIRAAGVKAGVLTIVGDFAKAAGAVYLSRWLSGGEPWIEAASGFLAVLGHNYSIFLLERKEGRWTIGGGAGGVSTAAVAMAFWPPSMLITVPVGIGLLYGLGYASVATMSVGFITLIVFAVRAWLGYGPWAYAAFGLASGALVVWGLRPNIRRLIAGNERIIGWRARRKRGRGREQSSGA